MPERIFDSIAHFVPILIVISLIFSLFLGRNNELHISLIGFLKSSLAYYHNPDRPVNAEPEFLVSDLQLESNLLLCLP